MTLKALPYKMIHPFPARMAPEIAIDECNGLPEGSVVVDPMVGSGTTIHAAVKAGCIAIGSDLDPLAVLMSKVRTTPINVDSFLQQSASVLEQLRIFSSSRSISSIDDDPETRKFVDYWFAEEQQRALRALSILISRVDDDVIRSALEITMSRLIVTKDRGASLGRDVSHSRPHKVRDSNDFDVFKHFKAASSKMAAVLCEGGIRGKAAVVRGDARALSIASGSVQMVITSPPYLNAIDYLRGHRLSLVWLGYSVADIRKIRGESVGAERGVLAPLTEELAEMRQALRGYDTLELRYQRIVDRYLVDLFSLYREQSRLLADGGRAVTVIGNSALRGSFLRNDEAATVAAACNGLILSDKSERDLPSSRRYLPPPRESSVATLDGRMRTETVLRFTKAATCR